MPLANPTKEEIEHYEKVLNQAVKIRDMYAEKSGWDKTKVQPEVDKLKELCTTVQNGYIVQGMPLNHLYDLIDPSRNAITEQIIGLLNKEILEGGKQLKDMIDVADRNSPRNWIKKQ